MAISEMRHELERNGPFCSRCHSSTVLHYVRWDNPNGNAGRPYYRCRKASCGKFAAFGDTRGIHNSLHFGQNVFCYCPSHNLPRLQVAGQGKKNPGILHWVCATGRCGLYAEWLDPHGNGTVCLLNQHDIDVWVKAGMI
jgi:hypothetical protein